MAGCLSSVGQIERMTHVDAIEEDIGLARVLGIPEEEPRLAVQGVELGVLLIARLLEQLDQGLAVPEVLAKSRSLGVRASGGPRRGTSHLHGHAAERPQYRALVSPLR